MPFASVLSLVNKQKGGGGTAYLKVVSRGDWQKHQYRSFVPFFAYLGTYPSFPEAKIDWPKIIS